MAIEQVIFSNLVTNEEYGRKVIPFLKEEYFPDYENKILFNLIILPFGIIKHAKIVIDISYICMI